MIPRRDELVRSVAAAWRLFLGDPRAMAGFDLTVEGFWRSFAVIVPIAPFYFAAALVERQLRLTGSVAEAFGEGRFFAVKAAIMAIDWVALPIVLALVARPLGIARNYAGFIVARNWASLLIVIPDTAVAVAFGLGLIGTDIAGFLLLAVLVVILRYRYVIARIALGAGIGFAIAITFADLLLSLIINAGFNRLFLD